MGRKTNGGDGGLFERAKVRVVREKNLSIIV